MTEDEGRRWRMMENDGRWRLWWWWRMMEGDEGCAIEEYGGWLRIIKDCYDDGDDRGLWKMMDNDGRRRRMMKGWWMMMSHLISGVVEAWRIGSRAIGSQDDEGRWRTIEDDGRRWMMMGDGGGWWMMMSHLISGVVEAWRIGSRVIGSWWK